MNQLYCLTTTKWEYSSHPIWPNEQSQSNGSDRTELFHIRDVELTWPPLERVAPVLVPAFESLQSLAVESFAHCSARNVEPSWLRLAT